jgi:hypothetical protein
VTREQSTAGRQVSGLPILLFMCCGYGAGLDPAGMRSPDDPLTHPEPPLTLTDGRCGCGVADASIGASSSRVKSDPKPSRVATRLRR